MNRGVIQRIDQLERRMSYAMAEPDPLSVSLYEFCKEMREMGEAQRRQFAEEMGVTVDCVNAMVAEYGKVKIRC